MNKKMFFKIFSISTVIINTCLILFLLISLILATTCNILVTSKFNFIILIVLSFLNISYFSYLLIVLITDKKSKKR